MGGPRDLHHTQGRVATSALLAIRGVNVAEEGGFLPNLSSITLGVNVAIRSTCFGLTRGVNSYAFV